MSIEYMSSADLIDRENRIIQIEEQLKRLHGKFASLVKDEEIWEDYEEEWNRKLHLLSEEDRKILWVSPQDRRKSMERIKDEQRNVFAAIQGHKKELELLKQTRETKLNKNGKRKKIINGKQEWKGTLMELANKTVTEYVKQKYRSLKDACRAQVKLYTLKGRRIKLDSLYTEASDIQRGERRGKNKQK